MSQKQNRRVVLRDMIAPEFQGMSPGELEFREDGTLARRDRWEQGIRQIAGIVGLDPRQGFEVAEVVSAVKQLVALRAVQFPVGPG